MHQTVKLKDFPEIQKLVRIADPSYKKHNVSVNDYGKVEMNDTYWEGGSRSTYTAVNMATGARVQAPQYNPPQFGGIAPTVEIPEGIAIVRTGIFLGKTSQATVYLNPANMAKVLENKS